jgi:hypothetical protein
MGHNGLIGDTDGCESSNKSVEEKLSKLLQVIRNAGYRLVGDESPKRGRERERTITVKRREEVCCSICGFTGRPCELKYATITRDI